MGFRPEVFNRCPTRMLRKKVCQQPGQESEMEVLRNGWSLPWLIGTGTKQWQNIYDNSSVRNVHNLQTESWPRMLGAALKNLVQVLLSQSPIVKTIKQSLGSQKKKKKFWYQKKKKKKKKKS